MATNFDYSNGDVTATLTRKVRNKGDEVAPVFWRVTYNRRHKLLKTGLSFSKEEWNDFLNRSLFKHKDKKDTLKKYFDNILKKAINALVENGDFSFDGLSMALNKGDLKSVNDAFRAKIKEMEERYAVGGTDVYRGTYKALLAFVNYKKLKNRDAKDKYIQNYRERKRITTGDNVFKIDEVKISWDEITVQFLNDWETFLLESGSSISTVAIRMRTIRTLINNKGGDPYLTGSRYPFGMGRYLIQEDAPRETFIKLSDVWRMEDYVPKNEAVKFSIDMFTFQFYGSGLNFKDLCLLRCENIENGEVRFTREKAVRRGRRIEHTKIPLLPPMMDIINRWGNKDMSGYIFPFLNGIEPKKKNEAEIKQKVSELLRTININLKTVARELNLPSDLSTNFARHSYMTHMISEEYLNEIIIKQMVGHSTRDVTSKYNTLTPDKRREINSRLLNPEKDYSKTIAI